MNSDGNITFGEADKSSTERNVARLLTGPPRVSPFLSDLDPTTGNGRVFLNAASDQYTVTWCNVRGFDSTRTTTVQATLLPNGTIEMMFGATVTITDAIVGLSPGRTGIFTPVNLSEPGPTGGGAAAVGERFAQQRAARSRGAVAEVLPHARRPLRSARALDRRAAHQRRLRVRDHDRQRSARHRPRYLQSVLATSAAAAGCAASS